MENTILFYFIMNYRLSILDSTNQKYVCLRKAYQTSHSSDQHLFFILQILSSHHDPGIAIMIVVFHDFPQSFQVQMEILRYLTLGHDYLLPNSFHFVIH